MEKENTFKDYNKDFEPYMVQNQDKDGAQQQCDNLELGSINFFDDENDKDQFRVYKKEIVSENGKFHIRLNESENKFEAKRNKLEDSVDALKQRFPELKSILEQEQGVKKFLQSIFVDGLKKEMYLRNLSFKDDRTDYSVLAIRPKLYDGDYLSERLPEGKSLLFYGHLSGRAFVVDQIEDTDDTEPLDFEIQCVATPYDKIERVQYNVLYQVLKSSDSLAEYAESRLEEWEDYLKWKKAVLKNQTAGCKYYKITVENNQLVFWLVCESEQYFNRFRKYLRRDLQAFDNSYSSDDMVFRFVDEQGGRNRKYSKGVELGRFRRVRELGYDMLGQEMSEQLEQFFEEPEARFGEEFEEGAEQENTTSQTKAKSKTKEAKMEARISKAFETPYVVQALFEVKRKDLDEINALDLSGQEAETYIYENVLPEFESEGFLAMSAIGESVLLGRFAEAIKQLKSGVYSSPNLVMWLFDAKRARLPRAEDEVEIEQYLNSDIENNENQKEAVLKMLQTPDLGLIQGPPGTGKTTVIAEGTYQFVKQGDRVLIASQSNDAVDNALERLANVPEVRAVRLGQNSRLKKNKENTNKFAEDQVLKVYYNAVDKKLTDNWLAPYDNMDARAQEYTNDLRDAQLFHADARELSSSLAKCEEENKQLQEKLAVTEQRLQETREKNEANKHAVDQYHVFQRVVEQREDALFFLEDAQLKCLEPILNPVLSFAYTKGINLARAEINVDIHGSRKENFKLAGMLKLLCELEKLKKRIEQAEKSTAGDSAEMEYLTIQKNVIKEALCEAVEAGGDQEQIGKVMNEFNQVKLKIDQLGSRSSVIEPTTLDRQYMSAEFLDSLNGEGRAQAKQTVGTILAKWKDASKTGLQALKACSEQDVLETTPLQDNILVLKGQLKSNAETQRQIRDALGKKLNHLNKLEHKYEAADAERLMDKLQDLQAKNQGRLERYRHMRCHWEDAQRKFRDRLQDENSFLYDREYYQDTYVRGCNVVGISCTDNMKVLDDKGYGDFDVVIIDEVSKATPPELLIPLMRARKAIWVGDHRQLPPMFNEHERSYEEMVENPDELPEDVRDLLTAENFKRYHNMVTASLFKKHFEQADASIKHSLLVQYRMHSDISSIINRFYDNRLENGMSPEQETQVRNHGLTITGVDGSSFITPDKHAYWLDSSVLPNGEQIYESFVGNSTSACNFLEVDMIIELLKKIADACREMTGSPKKTVGVISFYQKQVNELRDAMKKARKAFDFDSIDIEINTVDRFQGKEKQIVITSLVRNNARAVAGKHVIAFERINVAFSRAQELLVIVGAKHMYQDLKVKLPNMDREGIKTVPVYKNIMDDLSRKGCFKGSEKLITRELAEKIRKKAAQAAGQKDSPKGGHRA